MSPLLSDPANTLVELSRCGLSFPLSGMARVDKVYLFDKQRW